MLDATSIYRLFLAMAAKNMSNRKKQYMMQIVAT